MPQANVRQSEQPVSGSTTGTGLDHLIGDVSDLSVLGYLVGYNLRGIEPTVAGLEDVLETYHPDFFSNLPKPPSVLTWAERSVSQAASALPKAQRLRLEVAEKTELYTMYSLHEYSRESDAHNRVGRIMVSIINGAAHIHSDTGTAGGEAVDESFAARVQFVYSHAKELIDRRTAEPTFATQTVGTFIKNELVELSSIPVQRGQRFVRESQAASLVPACWASSKTKWSTLRRVSWLS